MVQAVMVDGMVAMKVVMERMRTSTTGRITSLRTCASAWGTTSSTTGAPADIPRGVPAVGVLLGLCIRWKVDPLDHGSEEVIIASVHIPLRIERDSWGGEGSQVAGEFAVVAPCTVVRLFWVHLIVVLESKDLEINLVFDPESLGAVGSQDRESQYVSDLHKSIVS
jgi:hypothetical protein